MTETERSLKNFKTENDDEFTKMFKELIDLKDDLEEKQKTAEAERSRIDLWEQTYSEPIKNRISYIEEQIKNKYAQELAENPKFKINNPWGKVTKRTTTNYDYGDEKELVKQLEETAPEFVKTKTEKSINKTELKKVVQVTETGAVCLFGEVLGNAHAEKVTKFNVEVI